MHFHESMPALVTKLRELGKPVDEHTVIIRDQHGRLMVGREDFIAADPQLENELRVALGGYSGDPIVIGGALARRLQGDPSARLLELEDGSLVTFVDRRIVGADWLRTIQPELIAPRRLVFASIKGGVGRSTALAVLAADLARSGKKVLAIDLDIEAPGIGSMLLPENLDIALDRRPRYGVADYLVENSLGGVSREELVDYIGVARFGDGSVDVVPVVGRETDIRPETMIAKVSRAMIEDMKDSKTVSVTEQIAEMIIQFTSFREYDAVLIDARAGLSEVTASPLIGLGAEVLLFGVDQPQTYRGYSYLLAHLSALWSQTDRSAFSAWRERLHFVNAKAPSAASKREGFRDSVYELCAQFLYESETLTDEGTVSPGSYQPSPEETGDSIPHDSMYVLNNSDYVAFDPISDETQLDLEVYAGPFGTFLSRARSLLKLGVAE